LTLALMGVMALSGCISPVPGPDGKYATPIGGAPVTENPTPYSDALFCLGQYAADHHIPAPHIAVAALRDLTGQLDANGGRPITQGAMLMAISALGKAGIQLVERYETDVPKLEFDLANNKLVSDQKLEPGIKRDYRAIYPGEVTGSDYFLAGGITELNSSIRSSKASATIKTADRSNDTATPSINAYVMNVGLDLRLINTISLDITDIVSYQKQIVGYEVGAGLFAFFGNQILSINGSSNAEEPIQLAVRSLIERAMFQLVSRLYKVPQAQCLSPSADPLQGAERRIPQRATPSANVAPSLRMGLPVDPSWNVAPPRTGATAQPQGALALREPVL
jgi:curli production assembly/transport component CsgG/holdfast attachment protein HfaB